MQVAPTSTSASIAIRYGGVSFSYESGEAPALDRVSLDVRRGERLGILGPNGGGKSTLLQLTLGLLRGYSGTIEVEGLAPVEAAKQRLIGYVPQRVEAELAFPITARHAASMAATAGLGPFARSSSASEKVERALSVVGATAFADRPVGQLSGGQMQRVMIARALASDAKILLLDEPTVGIDPAGQKQFAELIQRLHDELGLTTIVVSHDLRTVAATSDRVACLARSLHYHDSPEGLTPHVLAEVFRHDAAAIFGDLHVDAHRASECGHDHSHDHTHGPAHEHSHDHGNGSHGSDGTHGTHPKCGGGNS
ncbi:MAG: metal ABC transporter ATP-binding protein [Planctomycetes bacterium]|nr:metal ABC transporter ATP-binding protein [Planctomycetota bacterium]